MTTDLDDAVQAFTVAWVPKHITASTFQPRDKGMFVAGFVADAQDAGLSKDELESSLGNLELFLMACLDSASANG